MNTQTKTMRWFQANKQRIIKYLGILSIAALIFMYINHDIKRREHIVVKGDLQDELVTWKTKDSLNMSRIGVLESNNTESMLALKTKDSVIQKLQGVIKKYESKLKEPGSSVTVVGTETKVSQTSTETTTEHVETGEDSLWPVYKNRFNFGGWVFGNSTATKDSTSYNFTIRNEFDLVIGYDKKGLFKKPVPFVEMTNYNPYTETKYLRTYRVEAPAPYNFIIGPQIGVGFIGISQPMFYVGVGATIPLIRLRL